MSEVKVCPTCGTEYPVSERFCARDGSALRSQNPQGDLVGTVIAERYHVMKKLGEGGMGTVYLAEHVKMGRKSALKVMNPGMAQDADAIARFNREASNASRMNHPNICAIYDFGETPEGIIYLAMEFVEGEPLTAIIERQGALPPQRAASILHQTADALQVAHDYGIVHRDLKPDNIMIAKGRDGGDVVKVVDFGIAKAHTSDAQKVTKTGLVVGTPEYMSPEQLAGDKLDGRSDIYSLALVGFNMLTGALPFPSNSAQEAMIMRLTDEPKTLTEIRPGTVWAPGLQGVLDKGLARDAANRYQKAADFGREFAMAVDAMPANSMTEAGTLVISARAPTPNGGTAAIPKTRVASDAEKGVARVEPASTPVAKRGAGFAVAAVVIVAALGVGVWKVGFSGAGDGANPPTPPVTQTDSQTRLVDAGKAAGGGDQGTQRDGGRGTTPPNPARGGNVGGSGVTGASAASGVVAPPDAGGGVTTPSIASRIAALVLDAAILGDSSKANPAARVAKSRADALLREELTRYQRAEVLYLRGEARATLGDNEELMCTDFRDARSLAGAGTEVYRKTDAYFVKIPGRTEEPTCSLTDT